MMRRRGAPAWFTHGKTRERIFRWWPYGVAVLAASMYYMNPDPIEEVRVATLAHLRRPLLRATEFFEVHDLDPESLALELPPQLLFGPLSLEEQMKFTLYALRHDDDLADDYVTRLVIDHMDLSLDPPRSSASLVKAGGKDLVEFAVLDFTDKREKRRRKFFGPDQFLRLVNMVASHQELALQLLNESDGVDLVFKALKDAENEYARVLAMRTLTLFALQQKQDGLVESKILSGGHLPALVDAYRLSTGDPTDTRFPTMLLSSIMRIYGDNEAVYNSLVAENLVSAVVQNLNLTRYKGVPQHLRVLNDLRTMRGRLLEKPEARAAFAKPAHVADEEVHSGVGGVPRPVMPAPRTRLQAYFAKEEDAARMKREAEARDGVKMLPPRDLHAPVESLAYDCEFLPVALGVLDCFPEYFEASTEMLMWLDLLIKSRVSSSFELLEYRGASVLAKVMARLESEPAFFTDGGTGDLLRGIVSGLLHDEDCKPFVEKGNKLASMEMRSAVQNLRDFLDRFDAAKERRREEGLGKITTTVNAAALAAKAEIDAAAEAAEAAAAAAAGTTVKKKKPVSTLPPDNSFVPLYKNMTTPTEIALEKKARLAEEAVNRVIKGEPHVYPKPYAATVTATATTTTTTTTTSTAATEETAAA